MEEAIRGVLLKEVVPEQRPEGCLDVNQMERRRKKDASRCRDSAGKGPEAEEAWQQSLQELGGSQRPGLGRGGGRLLEGRSPSGFRA